MTASEAAPRAGLYVHVPYCRRRCPYCDFFFEVRKPDAGFVDAVLRELDARIDELGGSARAATLAFGGGTPSALPPRELVRLVDGVRERVQLDADAELSLEANPEDVTDDYVRALVDAGVTRASLGVQAFDDALLRYLGRAHNRGRALLAIDALVSARLSVGVDLIIGVPGEDGARIDDDAATCASRGVAHVSTYLLTVESGTALERLVRVGKRAAVDDDAQADSYQRAQGVLAALGYRQYEISNHARPGAESAHNRLYWSHAPYLGLGPGAHSMSLVAGGGVRRRHNSAPLARWLEDPPSAPHDDETLAPAHALREGVAFGLRDLLAGVDVLRLRTLHGVEQGGADDVALHAALDAAVSRGEVQRQGERVVLTQRGARFSDRVARDVLAGPSAPDALAARPAQR